MVSLAQFKTGIENHPTSIGQHDRRQPLTLSGRLLPISLAHLLVLSMTLALAVGAEASSLDTDNPCNECSVLDIDENGEVSALRRVVGNSSPLWFLRGRAHARRH